MKKLSKLSKECINNKGLCCENRINVIFNQKELKNLSANNKNIIVKKCGFFKMPYCSIYKKRLIDCKTYPITIDLDKNKLVFLIDLKCPAVKKGLINRRFIDYAKKLWKTNLPNKRWIAVNSQDNKNKNMYDWITIPQYLNYRSNLIKC